MGSVVFHLPQSWVGPDGTGLLAFYQRLLEGLHARGITCEVRALVRATLLDQVAADAAFHIVNHGRFVHPRVLNAGIAYVYPFWNLDPQGIRAFSSIADTAFQPARIDADAARPFFRKLRNRLVGKRISRYEQPVETTALPKGGTAVFLQDERHRDVQESCYVTPRQIVETALSIGSAPVLVKPHPQDHGPETDRWLAGLSQNHPRLHVTRANIHDIIAACDRVVTVNSAVGVEAYLHRKPVILCGRSDFHHVADVAQSVQELRAMIETPARKRPYDKFIYWYFAQMCLSVSDDILTDRFLDRLAQNGYDLR